MEMWQIVAPAQIVVAYGQKLMTKKTGYAYCVLKVPW
jgi:hypothetical protein